VRRRKVPKRHQQSDQEEENPKVAQTTKSRRRNKDFIDPDHDHVVVEEPEEDERMASSSKATKGRGKPKGPPSRKKARKLVISDEDEGDYLEPAEVPEEGASDEEEDHFSSEEERPRGAKGKGKVSAGRKRKAKDDLVSSPKSALERPLSSDLFSNKKLKPNLKLDESLLEGDAVSPPRLSAKTSPTTMKPESPMPQLKKLKLPAIKKNKPPGTTGTSTPTSATPATKPRLPLDIVSASSSKQSEIRKAQLGASDLDLSNKSIYQELFKTVGFPFSPTKISCSYSYRVRMAGCLERG
jgi:hypothetical protein